ncbi:unnamed protein product [Closterium sp. NIES-64]|nr:unnamed protein product [Closterium sp. NIES-65]CAI5980674.1 unnamed protein product [Closterium sp. NIES-64]
MSGSGRRASLDYSDLEAVRERVQQAAALWALAEDREREHGNQASDTDDDDDDEVCSSSSSSSSARGKQQGKLAAAPHQGSDSVEQQQRKSSSKLASQSHPQGGRAAAAEGGNQGRAKGPSRSKAGARGSLIRRWLNFGRS